MMKRIFSKKSGFTLVEIVVAFAVFAIMAAMILQILNLVLREKQNNAAFTEKFQKQEELIIQNGKEGEYDDDNKTDDINLKFTDDDEFNIGYQMKFPGYVDDDGNKIGYDDGLAYYIGPGSGSSDSDNPQTPGETMGNAAAGAQTERLDTRITGTRGFDSINVYQVVKDTTYAGPGARYFFEVSANGLNMADEMVPYAQYKMYFFMSDKYDDVKSSISYTAADGSTYQRKVPKAANIIDAGYVNSTNLSWNSSTCKSFSEYGETSQPAQNTYNIKKMNSNCIRIGTPYVSGNSDGAQIGYTKRGIRFKQSVHSRFYVVFEEDPKLTVNSFGETFNNLGNVESDGSKLIYKPVPIINDDGTDSGKTYVNIYGAFEYEKKTK